MGLNYDNSLSQTIAWHCTSQGDHSLLVNFYHPTLIYSRVRTHIRVFKFRFSTMLNNALYNCSISTYLFASLCSLVKILLNLIKTSSYSLLPVMTLANYLKLRCSVWVIGEGCFNKFTDFFAFISDFGGMLMLIKQNFSFCASCRLSWSFTLEIDLF